MNKQYSLVKRLNKEFIDELVKDNVEEECSAKYLEEPVCEEVREVFHVNQEQISDNAEEDQTTVTDQEDRRSSLERNQSFADVKKA